MMQEIPPGRTNYPGENKTPTRLHNFDLSGRGESDLPVNPFGIEIALIVKSSRIPFTHGGKEIPCHSYSIPIVEKTAGLFDFHQDFAGDRKNPGESQRAQQS